VQYEEIGGWFFQGAARSLLESVAAARRTLSQRSTVKATRRVNLAPSANQTMSVDPRVLLERAEDIILRILENPAAPRECPLCEGLMWDVRPFYDVADQIERAVPGVVTLPLPRLAADGSSSPDRWECDACGAFTITRLPTAGAKTWHREAASFGRERFPPRSSTATVAQWRSASAGSVGKFCSATSGLASFGTPRTAFANAPCCAGASSEVTRRSSGLPRSSA
jgi:hypothetical protein